MSKLTPAVSTKDHIAGPQKAPIELVEYGDYECPHCGRAYPIIKSIQKKMGDKLKFVFRNFPLAEAHPDATHAAIATEAAAVHGKYWEMHDILFEHQESLEDVYLIRYATKIGLDMATFKEDFDNPQFLKKVESDFESGIRSGVNGTPSFYINGQKFNGDWAEEYFLAYLQSVLP